MPLADLEQIKLSLEARKSRNPLICVTDSQHIHTDKDAKNVLYSAKGFNWHSAK
jgi:hypothetical protein